MASRFLPIMLAIFHRCCCWNFNRIFGHSSSRGYEKKAKMRGKTNTKPATREGWKNWENWEVYMENGKSGAKCVGQKNFVHIHLSNCCCIWSANKWFMMKPPLLSSPPPPCYHSSSLYGQLPFNPFPPCCCCRCGWRCCCWWYTERKLFF